MSDRSIRAFLRWLRSNGVRLHAATELHRCDGRAGFGLFVRGGGARLDADETLFEVPRSLLLSGASDAVEPWLAVIVALLEERAKGGDGSFWAPYIATLPTQFDTPLYWTDAELQELRGTQCAPSAANDAALREQFEAVRASASVPVAWDDFVWAGTIVQSRAFDVDGDDGGPSLVPLACALNACTFNRCAHLEGLAMVTERALESNEEIFNTYGDVSNGTLLQRYGYVDDGNPFAEAELTFDDACTFVLRNGLVSRHLVAFLTEEEEEEDEEEDDEVDDFLSLSSLSRALQSRIRAECKRALTRYLPHTLASDTALLAAGAFVSYRHYCASIVRRDEMTVLSSF